MPKEPDNLVLKLLREIRAVVDDSSKELEAHRKRFDQIDKKLDDMAETLTYSGNVDARER